MGLLLLLFFDLLQFMGVIMLSFGDISHNLWAFRDVNRKYNVAMESVVS